MLNFKKIMINIPILQQNSNIISKALKVLKENDLNLPLFDLELKHHFSHLSGEKNYSQNWWMFLFFFSFAVSISVSVYAKPVRKPEKP